MKQVRGTPLAWLCGVGLLLAQPAWGAAVSPLTDVPSSIDLEQSGAVIGAIRIDNQNIFDLADSADDVALFRLANRLHPRTRANIIRSQLLIRPGDRFNRHLIDETERILRANRYFYDAWIVPVSYHDNVVDLEVTTRDVWTFDPGFNFGRSGGANETGVALQELNLAGTGTAITLKHTHGIDRTASVASFSAAHAFGTWTTVSAAYGKLSDGELRELQLERPFYALEVRHAGGITSNDYDQIDSLYDRGQIIDQVHDHARFAEGYVGWSPGLSDGWVQRWRAGLTYDERLFTRVPTWTGPSVLPQDRRFAYPWIRWELLEDDYAKLRNHDQIARTEDFYLGRSASVRIGWADSALGSSRSALLLQSALGVGFVPSRHDTLLVNASFSGRLQSDTLANGVLSGAARYYSAHGPHWLFFTTLQAARGWNLDVEDQLLLGGDNGLRGYPLRYQAGTARALLTLEQRYFTDWYPFRLFRVGGALFFDAGRTWGQAPLGQPSFGLLKDMGFGLRLGNARSGLGNVVHVDLAFPFDGDPTIKRIQFLVQTEESF